MRIAQSWDGLAVFMLFMAYFFVALLIFLRKSFCRLTFYISWWAFTFPLTAVTIASAVAYQVTAHPLYKYLGFLLFVISLVFISLVTWHTLHKISRGEICVNEDEQ
jgi:tellurite resistance protein